MLVNTIYGPMDDALLREKTGQVDNENEYTTWVEYCLADCEGNAHRTNKPDSAFHFCGQHVHRSVDMRLKKMVSTEGAAANLV